jgi:hypothetical protein
MAQYVEGGAVAPRPVLEIIKQPLYDTVSVPTGATTTSFFAQPVGSADSGAAVGVKTFSETNLRRAGALATPQQFDIYALSVKYRTNIVRADHTAFQNGAASTQAGANYNLEIGQKSYLRVKLETIPQDTSQIVDALAVAADAVHSGWSLHSNVFDVSIPEELFDPTTGRTFLTGRRVPIHIPSEQQFSNTLEYVGGITLVGSSGGPSSAQRVSSVLWGCLKREVQ